MQTENLLRRIDLAVMYQPLVTKIGLLVAACRARGLEYWAISGERTFAEQNGLYALGRTKPNVDATPDKPMGGIVTKARAGSSCHNYAIAVDFAFDKDTTRAGLQPDWAMEKYRILAEEATKLGLEAGFYWQFKDAPHVQLPLARNGITIAQLLALYNQGGKKAVFHKLDQYRW